MPFAAHPGRLLKRELQACELSASRIALDLGVPSGRRRVTRSSCRRPWARANRLGLPLVRENMEAVYGRSCARYSRAHR
jgi:hypothetical protein